MVTMTNNNERLTPKQMKAKYPDLWLGLKDVDYQNGIGSEIISAVVYCYDVCCTDIILLQINKIIEDKFKADTENDPTAMTMLSIPKMIEGGD